MAHKLNGDNEMDYKQLVNSTINRMDQPSFDAVKKALVGEYLSFSIISEYNITREILSEKVCDYFEKFGLKSVLPVEKQVDKQIDSQFNGQIENYLRTWDSIVNPKVRLTPRPRKNGQAPAEPRARKYYDKAWSIKSSRVLSVRNLIDYSRIMMCLYVAIVENKYKAIEDFDFSIDKLVPDKIIDDLKRYKVEIGPIRNNRFNLEELYCPDTCFFILVIIVLYTILNDRVVGEFENE